MDLACYMCIFRELGDVVLLIELCWLLSNTLGFMNFITAVFFFSSYRLLLSRDKFAFLTIRCGRFCMSEHLI